eukprot:TRINITY_DN9483_c0_g1_i1.p1 TRINITY_DN9483_c0_g1~~TRINITY_DN9483_c0_g1_i1.p1  ORF type:complete len:307 (+),score=35.67 TRINITY_DN9483_c0_g1_i1:47-967(+)
MEENKRKGNVHVDFDSIQAKKKRTAALQEIVSQEASYLSKIAVPPVAPVAKLEEVSDISTPEGMVLWWGSGAMEAWRCQLCLFEKNIPYTGKMVTFSRRDHKSPSFLRLNPRGKVPVLQDRDITLFESMAIMQYLDAVYPGPNRPAHCADPTGKLPPVPSLMPTALNPRGHAYALSRLHVVRSFQRTTRDLYPFIIQAKPMSWDKKILQEITGRIHAELAIWNLEFKTASQQFILPSTLTNMDGPSLVDLAFFPSLAFVVRYGIELEGKYPHLAAYFQRMVKRPSVIKTWPPHWTKTRSTINCFSV